MNLLLETLPLLFERELHTMRREIEACPEALLWQTLPGLTNTPGMLAQHIVGNLNHFVGHGLAGTGYQRNRDAEFTDTGRTKEQLVADLDGAIAVVTLAFASLDADALDRAFPIALPPIGLPLNTGGFLLQLYHHLSYHLGQLNYLRRALGAEGSPAS